MLIAVRFVDETPEPEDVKAGWGAFAIFLLLIGAVVVLGFSLTKQLQRPRPRRTPAFTAPSDPAAKRAPRGPTYRGHPDR